MSSMLRSSVSRLLRAPLPRLAPVRVARSSARCFSAAAVRLAPSYEINPGDAQTYHAASEATMDTIVESLEALVESGDPKVEGCDVEYHSGVLTLKLGDVGTYVINKQPPNKQIWLSSPKSGPKRFDYDSSANEWFYSRDNSTLRELLNTELSEFIGKPVDVLENL